MRKELPSQPFTISGLFALISGPDPEGEIETAAAILAGRPRKPIPRKWTGYLVPNIKSSRLWRGRQVITPDCRVLEVYGCRRGLVVTRYNDPFLIEPVFQIFRAADLRLYKSPAAIRLAQGRRGIKEEPSLKKLESCRRNGARGGRPRSSQTPVRAEAG